VVDLTPARVVAAVADQQLELSWPADHTGWRLEMQTNAPLTGLGTNWTTWPGSVDTNRVLIPLPSTVPAALFRLAYP
jgi:hypothetical protein